MLDGEIEQAQRLVRTDAYQMSLGEIVSMYEAGEIIIHPEFQRLFRWTSSQKSRLIESLLLGIPLPPIFVFEKEDGKWELIDGLQRLSTILEFMGLLIQPDGTRRAPSLMEATRYLPSLHNVVWERSDGVEGLPQEEQVPLDKRYQLSIRRARFSVEILKRPSENQTKFDLFQRLNSGGTQANSQELRNCVMLMIHEAAFRLIKAEAETQEFLEVMNASDEQIEKQRHMEFASRFLVHTNVPYDNELDVEEYIDEGINQILPSADLQNRVEIMRTTFSLLKEAAGRNALRRFDGNNYVGKAGLVGLEGVAVGVGKNLAAIRALPDPVAFIRDRSRSFWNQQATATFTSPGLRGTSRIQRTVPFGEIWFRP